MSYGTPTGYAIHTAIHCPRCAPVVLDEINKGRKARGEEPYELDGEDDGFFAIGVNGNEVDYPDHCTECAELIEGQTLTAEGETYVLDALLDYCTKRIGLTTVLDAWRDLFWHDDAATLALYDTVREIRGWRHDEREDIDRALDAVGF